MLLRLLASLAFVVFAIALGVVPATADLARAPDATIVATDLQATLTTSVDNDIGAIQVANIASVDVNVLTASSAFPSTSPAIAARSMPVIWEIAATTNDNTGDVSTDGNFPNPFNATAKTITPVTATATTGSMNDVVQAIATTSADDNFGSTARSSPITMAAQGADTSLTAFGETSPGVDAGATMRIAA